MTQAWPPNSIHAPPGLRLVQTQAHGQSQNLCWDLRDKDHLFSQDPKIRADVTPELLENIVEAEEKPTQREAAVTDRDLF